MNWPVILKRFATISDCDRYRYTLGRCWRAEHDWKPLLWIMLNPSTANAHVDDATIIDITLRTWRWSLPPEARNYPGRPAHEPFTHFPEVGGLLVGNVYGFRATDPMELRDQADPIGPRNDEHLRTLLGLASHVVCAWGNGPTGLLWNAAHRMRCYSVLEMIREAGHAPWALDMSSKSGMPRHPLYWRASAQLFPFPEHFRK